jgi:hypothetical protein
LVDMVLELNRDRSNRWEIDFHLNDIPGASQRLPVNCTGQLHINPAPKLTHWPPLRHGFDAHGFRGWTKESNNIIISKNTIHSYL